MLLLRHVRYQHTTITYYMLCMLGTQTAELESHNVRGPSCSATHTGAIVLHADLGSKDRCRISIQHLLQHFQSNSQNALKFYWSLKPLRYLKLYWPPIFLAVCLFEGAQFLFSCQSPCFCSFQCLPLSYVCKLTKLLQQYYDPCLLPLVCQIF